MIVEQVINNHINCPSNQLAGVAITKIGLASCLTTKAKSLGSKLSCCSAKQY